MNKIYKSLRAGRSGNSPADDRRHRRRGILAGLVADRSGGVRAGRQGHRRHDGLGDTAVTVWASSSGRSCSASPQGGGGNSLLRDAQREQPKFRWISLGAVVAIVTWVIATALFGLYVSQFSNYNKTYGSLAGVIVTCSGCGSPISRCCSAPSSNAEVERGRQLQAGIRAEDDLQLPPRDTRVSDKTAAKDARDVEQGQQLRRSHGDNSTPPT